MKRILSGIRPTGGIHLGHYVGVMKQWVELAPDPDYDCYFMIADYHALLSFRETPLNQASLDLVAWELAMGVDPAKVTMFAQSAISAHTELNWIFNALVTVPELGRMTQYKDLVAQGTEQPSAALLTYPVLQTADILLYHGELVPIGEDNVQHLELARTIAKRFNAVTKSTVFKEPRARLTSAARIMSLHDPSKKMSKSLPQGALLLEDDEATLRSKIARAVTDTGPSDWEPIPADLINYNDPLTPEQQALLFTHMSPGVRNLFVILKETSTDEHQLDVLLHNYKAQSLQYKDLKAAVADAVVSFIIPMQEKYKAIRSNEATLKQILADGNAKAKAVADATLKEAKAAFNLLD